MNHPIFPQILRFAAALAIWLCAASAMAQQSASPQCMPEMEAAIDRDGDEDLYLPSGVAEPVAGYVDEEYIIHCRVDGQSWRTVLNLRRPVTMGEEPRTVIVEPTHPGNLWPVLSSVGDYLQASGHVSIAINSSRFVVEELVKPVNPQRYGDLRIPEGEAVESEILAQLASLIQNGGLPGVRASSVILAGYSNTAARVRQYIRDRHAGARLENGRAVYDGYFPGQTAVGTRPGPIPDLDVPVIELQGEREVIATLERNPDGLDYRRGDSPRYRLYEVPGMSHIDTSEPGSYPFPPEWCGIGQPAEIPLGRIWANALERLILWVEEGRIAPRASRIMLEADGETIARDEYGNARGGYPLVHIRVPVFRYRAVSENRPGRPDARCDMIGPQFPLPEEVLERRYDSRQAYLDEFDATLRSLVASGWYLALYADELRTRARDWAGEIPQ